MNQTATNLSNPVNPPEFWRRLSCWLAFISLLFYGTIYLLDSETYPWAETVIYAMIILAALLAAVLAARVWRLFQPDDPPRRVWSWFTLGLWFWAVAEVIWYILHQLYEELPDVNLVDIFWVGAYLSFALAVYEQYRQIHPQAVRRIRLAGLLLGVLTLLAVQFLNLRLRQSLQTQGWTLIGSYLAVLYPVSDLVIGLAAFNLVRMYGAGLWGRAWWGLIAFAVSDGITSWYYLGGNALLSEQADLYLSLFTDLLYYGAYLIFVLACVSRDQLMRHGQPGLSSRLRQEFLSARFPQSGAGAVGDRLTPPERPSGNSS